MEPFWTVPQFGIQRARQIFQLRFLGLTMAAVDPAFIGVGQSPGLEIWRIEVRLEHFMKNTATINDINFTLQKI